MTKNKKQLIITSIVCVLPMIVGAILYSRLPEQLPTHFDMKGNVDDYSSKAFVCFGLPIIMLLINLFVHIGINNDPKSEGANKIAVGIGQWTAPVTSIIISIVSFAPSLGVVLPETKTWIFLVGILIIVLGNYLPKCRQNYTVGIKLPWTLNDVDNWNKTHRMAGVLWIICGILFSVSAFLGKVGEGLMIAIIIIMVCVPAAYSYALYKKKNA